MLDDALFASMLPTLKRIGRRSADAHYECRRCGTTVETPADDCPACSSTDIASFDF